MVGIYQMLEKWIPTDHQLKVNGFPRPHPSGIKGFAKIYVANPRSRVSKTPNERICFNCGKSYMIDENNFQIKAESCTYHNRGTFVYRGRSSYSCCQQTLGAKGCCSAICHVWRDLNIDNLSGFVSTSDKNLLLEENKVYALDCEMSYTTQDLELTKVTLIDENYNVVYETLVKPELPIIFYNTQFSGITEEDMRNVTTTLKDVQAVLLSKFSAKTILVGHGLDSDLKVLKILHDRVVDSSILFPHKRGLPYKRSLKSLYLDHLGKTIRTNGHDSKEDARASMELIKWKVQRGAGFI